MSSVNLMSNLSFSVGNNSQLHYVLSSSCAGNDIHQYYGINDTPNLYSPE